MLLALAVAVMLQGATPAPAQAPARPGVITGELRGPDGNPVGSVRVSALPAPSNSNRPSDGQNYFATVVPQSTALADAKGRYRLTNLAPGRYLILASMLGFPTFYPSTTVADEAAVVTVTGDAPTEGVNVTIVLPPGGRVSGQITPPTGGVPGERAILSGLELGELIEVPIDANGTFAFGHIPAGPYLVSLFPTPPGMPSKVFFVEENADSKLELVRPTLYNVTGRLVVPKGPLPFNLLGFITDTSYVGANISPDGTFRAQMQPAKHYVELAGMPIGYAIASVKQNGKDTGGSIEVGKGDVSGIEITLALPQAVPAVRGRITGVPAESLKGARIELVGRIISKLETAVQADGSFAFPAVTPGTYWVQVAQIPAIRPFFIVVGLNDETVDIRPAAPR